MVWILVPTLARAYADVNELITTLLLNFVAFLLVAYVATGPWRDRVTHAQGFDRPYRDAHSGSLGVRPLGPADRDPSRRWSWPASTAIRAGATRSACAAPIRARPLYAGIPVRRRIVAVMLLSGAVAGLAGMLELAGTVHRLQGGISNNYGYLGIMVAVLARGSSLGVIAGAVLMGVILNAGIILQTQGINTSTVLAITGLILFLTSVGDEAAHYRIVPVDRRPA